MSNSSSFGARRFGLLCLIVTTTGWGLNWPAMKIVLRELPPFFARGSAGLLAALGFAIAAFFIGQELRIPRAVLARLVLASLINVFVWMGFATLSMRWLTVAQCSLLVYTMPIWATLLTWPIAGVRPTLSSTLGLLMCLAGLSALFGGDALRLDDSQLIGAGLALSAAVLFAFGTVALKPITEIGPIAMLAWQLGIGCLPMVLIGLFYERPDLTQVASTTWSLMLYVTVVPMGLCYLAWFAALRRLPPATASVATLLTPVIGVVSASLALGEPLGGRELLALVLTVSGIGLAMMKKR